MRRYNIALLFVGSLLFAQCSLFDKFKNKDDDGDTPADTEEGSYTSHWYYSYEAVDQITFETMGLGSADEFDPYVVAVLGDTLFVSNAAGTHALIAFSKEKRSPIAVIDGWAVNGQAKGFTSRIEAIVPAGERLYVVEQASRIHVFGLPELDYITCIGNGSWGGPVFQSQAVAVKDGMIYSRDKSGTVSLYKESDATAENYEKVQRYKIVAAMPGVGANNGFNPHYMEFGSDGKIMLTDYEGMAIRTLDPSLVTDGMKNGTSIDMEERKLPTDTFKPRVFASLDGRLYVTGNNGAINIYDTERKEWVKMLKSVKGFAFDNPERVCADGDILWVSDYNKKILVKMGVFKNEIREYSEAGPDMVEVATAATYGEEPETFYVNINTHEVVEPSEE